MNTSDIAPASKWDTDRMRGPAWLRAIVATLACTGATATFVYAAVLNSHGSRDLDALGAFIVTCFFGVPLLIVGVLSIIIAAGLFSKTVLGIKVALIVDSIVVLAVMAITAIWLEAFYVPRDPLGEQITFDLLPAAIALPFCVEAAWLLSACRDWKRAWWGLGLVMLVMIVGPLAAHILHGRNMN